MVVERVLMKEALKAVDLGWLLESEKVVGWAFLMASCLVLLKDFVKGFLLDLDFLKETQMVLILV